MLELAAQNNSSGVVVNHGYITAKAGKVGVMLINTTDKHLDPPALTSCQFI